MKILAIIIENYGPFYGRHEVPLADLGLVAVMGHNADEPRMNSNGAGKSSLVDALDWAAFGVAPRGDGADAMVNDRARKEGLGCRVEIVAEDEDTEVRIVRTRGGKDGNSLRLWYGGDEVTSFDAKQTQAHVQFHLGLDRQVFHSAVLFAQQDLFRFVDATDAERLQILTAILGLEEIDTWLAQAKKREAALAHLRHEHERELAAYKATFATLSETDVDAPVEAYEAQRERSLAQLAEQRHEHEREVLARRRELTEAQGQGVGAAPTPPGPDPMRVRIEADRQEGRRTLALVEQSLAQARALVANSDKQAGQGPRCAACGQAVTAAHMALVSRQRDAAQKQVAAAEQTQGQWRDYLVQVEQAHVAMECRERQAYRDFEEARTRHRVAAHAVATAERLLRDSETCLARNAAHAEAVASATNPAIAQRASHWQRLKHAHKAMGLVDARLKELVAESVKVAFWTQAFGPKGLKSYVLEARLGEMTQAANDYCKMLTGGTFWVRLESQTALKSGAMRNRFAVRVFHGQGGKVVERAFRSLSGGQRQRISLAVDFGLSRLIAQRAKKRYGLLILDEVFRHLDARGRDAVMEMLVRLKGEKDTILVVDHDAEFQSMFERRLTVTMSGGQATIENHHKEAA